MNKRCSATAGRNIALCALACSMAGSMRGVITDATVLTRGTTTGGSTTVCLLLDSHSPTLHPHTEPGSFYRPLLHMGPDGEMSEQIEHECIAQHQTEALRVLIGKSAKLGPVLTFPEDPTAPLPVGCSLDTTPNLCNGYATFNTRVTSCSSDTLSGLFWKLQTPAIAPNAQVHNADVRTALEGLLPIYNVRDTLSQLRDPNTTLSSIQPLCQLLETSLLKVRATENRASWRAAIDESLTRMQAHVSPATYGERVNEFFESEAAMIRQRTEYISAQLSGLKDCRPQLKKHTATGRLAAKGGFAHTVRLACELIELAALTLNCIPDLEVMTTAVALSLQPDPLPRTIFAITHATHVVRISEILRTVLGFQENPLFVQRIKEGPLKTLLEPACRVVNPMSLAERREQTRNSSIVKTWSTL